jgi:hypothetical protein
LFELIELLFVAQSNQDVVGLEGINISDGVVANSQE